MPSLPQFLSSGGNSPHPQLACPSPSAPSATPPFRLSLGNCSLRLEKEGKKAFKEKDQLSHIRAKPPFLVPAPTGCHNRKSKRQEGGCAAVGSCTKRKRPILHVVIAFLWTFLKEFNSVGCFLEQNVLPSLPGCGVPMTSTGSSGLFSYVCLGGEAPLWFQAPLPP